MSDSGSDFFLELVDESVEKERLRGRIRLALDELYYGRDVEAAIAILEAAVGEDNE